MTNEQKRQVKDALARYVAGFPSQALAADSLQGISASTISQVKNHNWELLSDRLWLLIARQVGFYCGQWQDADTSPYLLLRILFGDAQHYTMSYGVAMPTGLGKTFAARRYTQLHAGAYTLAARADHTRKSFLSALLTTIGCQPLGTVPQMIASVTTHLATADEPLLIIDDTHLLKDRVLHMLVLLANSLAGQAGIVLLGNDTLRTRIIDGVRLKKPGYDEIYRTIGRRFITLGALGPNDVGLVCQANGLTDEQTISQLTASCQGSLHPLPALLQQITEHKMAA